LYGVGYARSKTADDFRRLIGDAHIDLLVDIRFSPRSRFNPNWSKNNTEGTVRAAGIASYRHEQGLGNPNFRDPGHMTLADWSKVGDIIEALKSGVNVAIMCACAKYSTCHRQLVVQKVKEALPDVEVVHLGEEGQLGL